MRTHDAAETIYGVRDGEMIEGITLKVPHETALHAAVVVMVRQVGIETNAVLALAEGIEQTEVREQP